MQASKDAKPDVVEHMFTKVKSLLSPANGPTGEMAIETMIYIGGTSMRANDYDAAYKWYLRADELFREDAHQPAGSILRQDIFQGLIESLVAKNSAKSNQQARQVLSLAEKELGDRLVILHWKLDILENSAYEADIGAYARTISKLIDALDFTDHSLRKLFYHTDRLAKRDMGAACHLLDKLLADEMFQSTKRHWFEISLVSRFKYTVEYQNMPESVKCSAQSLHRLPRDMLLSRDAAQAIHSVCAST